MAQNTSARAANNEDRNTQDPERQTTDQRDEQTEMFREFIQELRRDRQTRLQLPQRQTRPITQETFKPPEFSSVGSVEIFIRQFLDGAEANQWEERTTVLHLRRALRDEARDCGGTGESLAAIFTAFRARFGITTREAKVGPEERPTLHCSHMLTK